MKLLVNVNLINTLEISYKNYFYCFYSHLISFDILLYLIEIFIQENTVKIFSIFLSSKSLNEKFQIFQFIFLK